MLGSDLGGGAAVDVPPGSRLRPVRVTTLTGLAALFGLAVTFLVLVDLISVGYQSVAGHLVLDTVAACVALLVAYLIYGRFVRSRGLQDLLLLQGLLLLGIADLGPTVLQVSDQVTREGTLDVWLSVAVRILGVVLLTAGALSPRTHLRSDIWRWFAPVPAVALYTVIAGVLWGLSSRLPVALDPSLSPASSNDLWRSGHPVLVGALLFTVICFGIASVAFTRQASGSTDELLRWLGAACALAMFARLNYAMFPSVYSQWLYAGDLLRTGFYLLMLVGAAREIRQYWVSQVHVAVLEDRRRLARELHDGVLQELTYIRSEGQAFQRTDAHRTQRISAACDRALDEARQAVEALGSAGNEPFGFALHRAIRQVAERYDVALDVEVDDSVMAADGQRHALLRIVREAASNAARHGAATRIRLELAREAGDRRLTVVDNGQGFDVARESTRATGFGLQSMRERAEGLPGDIQIVSSPEHGTAVTVRW